jgi:hypothetical protein
MFLLACQAGLWADETNTVSTNAVASVSQNSFEAFRIIAQRNIFNPNRSARGGRTEGNETARVPRGESFALVGTMLYENGNFAFFDSSSSSYKKVLKPGDSIAGYTLSEVAPDGIKLEADGKTLTVAVGQELRRQREGTGDWVVGGKAVAEKPSSSSDKSSSASSDDEDEQIKRLMKKREEEMNK